MHVLPRLVKVLPVYSDSLAGFEYSIKKEILCTHAHSKFHSDHIKCVECAAVHEHTYNADTMLYTKCRASSGA